MARDRAEDIAQRASEKADGARRLITRTASTIAPRPVEWLWYKRIPLGKITIVAGDPGTGKSVLAADIAAVTSLGERWPDGDETPSGHVLIISAEDDVDDTIIPRLLLAKANLDRIEIVFGVGNKKESSPWTLDCAAELDTFLAAEADQGRRYKLVIGDPVSALFPTMLDSHKNAEVRAGMMPIARCAAARGFAFVGIEHLNKKQEASPMHRVLGSIGFIGCARAAHFVVADANEESRRLFMPLKQNLSRAADALAFRVVEEKIQANGRSIRTARIAWEREPVDVKIDEVLRASSRNPERGDRLAKAIAFVAAFLQRGPQQHGRIIEAAGEQSIAPATLRRAKAHLQVVSYRAVADGPWFWRLPVQGG